MIDEDVVIYLFFKGWFSMAGYACSSSPMVPNCQMDPPNYAMLSSYSTWDTLMITIYSDRWIIRTRCHRQWSNKYAVITVALFNQDKIVTLHISLRIRKAKSFHISFFDSEKKKHRKALQCQVRSLPFELPNYRFCLERLELLGDAVWSPSKNGPFCRKISK